MFRFTLFGCVYCALKCWWVNVGDFCLVWFDCILCLLLESVCLLGLTWFAVICGCLLFEFSVCLRCIWLDLLTLGLV